MRENIVEGSFKLNYIERKMTNIYFVMYLKKKYSAGCVDNYYRFVTFLEFSFIFMIVNVLHIFYFLTNLIHAIHYSLCQYCM